MSVTGASSRSIQTRRTCCDRRDAGRSRAVVPESEREVMLRAQRTKCLSEEIEARIRGVREEVTQVGRQVEELEALKGWVGD